MVSLHAKYPKVTGRKGKGQSHEEKQKNMEQDVWNTAFLGLDGVGVCALAP